MVPGLKNLPHKERLREIMDRVIQNVDLIEVFKIVKGLSICHPSDLRHFSSRTTER